MTAAEEMKMSDSKQTEDYFSVYQSIYKKEDFEIPQDPSYSCDLTKSFMDFCVSYMMSNGETKCGNESVTTIHDDEEELLPVIDLLQSDENDVINLHPSPLNGGLECDRWTNNACLILQSIEEMIDYLKRESYGYVGSFIVASKCISNILNGVDDETKIGMNNTDKSIFESTVTSFTVSTANQIEQLRQTATANKEFISNHDLMNHREGVVAILLYLLQSKVMAVMSDLHKVRTRKAMKDVLNDPLGCCKGFMSIPVQQTMKEVREMGMEGNLSPQHIQMMLQNDTSFVVETDDINTTYSQNTNPHYYLEIQRREDDRIQQFLSSSKGSKPFTMKAASIRTNPPIRSQQTTTNSLLQQQQQHPTPPPLPPTKQTTSTPTSIKPLHQQPYPQPASMNSIDNEHKNKYKDQEEAEYQYMQNLQRENTLLTSQIQQSTQSLNEIHKIEQSMMQITSLLNQFANLISEQQEDVMFIHEAAQETKDKMEKGTDNIVDATERAKKGSHYMAKSIYAMGIVLLFLNWAL